MQNLHIVIAGGTGFIGEAMAAFFSKENRVTLLTRGRTGASNNRFHTARPLPENVRLVQWNGKDQGEWSRMIDGCDVVINLAGQSVNCRYTAKNKAAIFDSRINTTTAIGDAIRQAAHPPALWVNAASATIYRHSTLHAQDEFTGEISAERAANEYLSSYDRLSLWLARLTGTSGKNRLEEDFSVQVCQRWEHSFFSQPTPATRKAALRIAITLGNGGVMMPYLTLAKWGLGGHQGNGSQYFSWIHVTDVCRIIVFLWEHTALEGVFNASSPNPVTGRIFSQTLARICGRRLAIPAPVCMLQCGARLIGTETELLLKSRRVLPLRLLQEGFVFRYPQLPGALENIVATIPRRRYHLF